MIEGPATRFLTALMLESIQHIEPVQRGMITFRAPGMTLAVTGVVPGVHLRHEREWSVPVVQA